MASSQDADVPPIEDVEAGVMGLTEVEPSPVEETPIEYREKSYFPDQTQGESWGPGASGVNRTGTLGLKLGDHGVVWWCTSPIITSKPSQRGGLRNGLNWMRANRYYSDKNPTLLLLRLHSLHILSHRKRLYNTALHTLRRRVKSLFTPHTTILPILPLGAITRRHTLGRTRWVRNRTTLISPETSVAAIRRRDEERSQDDSLACTERNKCLGICACPVGELPCVEHEDITALCAWRFESD